MKKLRFGLYGLLLLCLSGTAIYAQESPTASGGEASGSGGTVSYSVGQVFYTTHADASNSVAQGVQQPYEISVIIGVETQPGIQLTLTAFPNPTTNSLTLSIENYNQEDMLFQLYDVTGRLLRSQKITESQTLINVQDLVPASYLLRVSLNDKDLKTFKIIKY